MRKEITFEEALKLKDGTIVWVDDLEEFGGKNIKHIKEVDKLKEVYGVCYYNLNAYKVYVRRGVKLFIEEEPILKDAITINGVYHEVSKEIFDKVKELVIPKAIEINKEHAIRLFELLMREYKYIAQDEDGGVYVYKLKPTLDCGEWDNENDYYIEEYEYELELYNGCYSIKELIRNYFKEGK